MNRRFVTASLWASVRWSLFLLLCAARASDLGAVEASIKYIVGESPDGVSEAVVVQGVSLAHTAQILPLDKCGAVVGGSAVDAQFAQALFNMEAALAAVGSGSEQLVRINFYVDQPKTAASMQRLLARRFPGPVRPAVSWVATSLPHPEARLALDAVAALPDKGPREVVRKRCQAFAGYPSAAQVAVLPLGEAVYVSGQAERGGLTEATQKTMASLIQTIGHLGLDRNSVVHLKAFMQPMEQAEAVQREMTKAFGGGTPPPMTLVEWAASSPIEIEMIAFAPAGGETAPDTVSYFTPPGIQASPVYSRVARVHGGKAIYVSGLHSREAGNGEVQVRDIFASLNRVLKLSGSDLLHLVKATYYCADSDSSKMLNKIRPEFYDPQRPPAGSKAMVKGLATPHRSITLDMIAVTPP